MLLAAMLTAPSVTAQCTAGPIDWQPEAPTDNTAPLCAGFIYCNEPQLDGPIIEVDDGCDPTMGVCTRRRNSTLRVRDVDLEASRVATEKATKPTS